MIKLKQKTLATVIVVIMMQETQQKISELLMEAEKEQSNSVEEAESTDAQQGETCWGYNLLG